MRVLKLISKLLILFCSVYLFQSTLYAQKYSFEIEMGTDGDEVPIQFKLNDSGDYIGIVNIAPPTDSIYVYNTYLYKISPLGDTISIKYSKTDTSFVYFYITRLTTEPKGFLLSGLGNKHGESINDPFVIMRRIDDNLDLVWEKTFKFDYYFGSYRSAAMELINGDIVYACSPHIDLDMFLLKLSSEGDSLDFAHYSGTESGEVFGLTYSPDSTNIWLHTEWAHYAGMGGSLISCIVLNDELEQIGVKHYPEFFFPPFNSILFDNNTLLTGGSQELPNMVTQETEFTIKAYLLDSLFNVMHEITLTNPDTNSRGAESHCIDFYHLSCIYLGGNHYRQGIYGSEPNWFYVTKLNDTLGVEYEKYIGGDDYYYLYNVTATADGGVLLAGTMQEPGMTYLERDGFIVKLDSLGCVTGLPNESDIAISDAVIYPNPGTDVLNIRTALKECEFHLFDIWGMPISTQAISGHITSINTNYLSKGNYYYSVTKNKKIIISGSWIRN